jgi:HAD superfamily hydrolase (TIGR01509 family)
MSVASSIRLRIVGQRVGNVTIKAVVFDLDGTIAAFNLDYRAVRMEVRGLLISEGIPHSILAVNESIFEMLKKTELFLKNSGKPESAARRIRKRALAIAEKREFEAAQTTKLLPNVLQTLKALKKMKLKIGLCTINSHKATEHILNRLKIKEYFDAITPRDKVKFVKPNAEHLRATLKALEIKPREAVIVGDGGVDMRCARELGMLAVGLPADVSPQQELVDSGANYIITTMTDLPVLLDDMNRTTKRREVRDRSFKQV